MYNVLVEHGLSSFWIMQECGKLANKPTALKKPPVCAQTVLPNEVCTDSDTSDTINYNHGLGHCVLFQSTGNNVALFLHTLPPISTYYFKSGYEATKTFN